MQALGRILAAGGPPAYDDYWYEPRGVESTSGTRVDMASSIGWTALYAGVAYIAEDIAKVPFGMLERLEGSNKQAAPGHWLHPLLHDQPNGTQGALEFREMMTAFAMLRGEGIAELRGTGRRRELVPLHPDLLSRNTNQAGALRYDYRDPLQRGAIRTILADELLIIRGRLGRGIIDIGRDAIGLQLAIQRGAGRMFSRGARHQGVVSRPLNAPWDDVTREAFRKALAEYGSGGAREGRPLLLEDGMTWQNASMTAQEAEVLGQMRWGVAEASRLTRIPPHKLFELERSTNNNIDRQSIDYVVDGLLGWAKRWEQAVYRDLLSLSERERWFAEHTLDGLMRGDPATRSQAYTLAIQWGWMTRNEVRRLENLNALPGLDEPLTPLNMTTGSGQINDAVRGQLRLFASDAASRVVRREVAAIAKLVDRTSGDVSAFRSGIDTFYAEHESHVAAALHIPEHEARRYARAQRAEVLSDGPAVMDIWLVDRVAELATLAMNQAALAA